MSRKKITIDNLFSERLRELIEEKLRINHGEFAKIIGITSGYLSMVVTGKRGPSAQLIAGIFTNYSEYLPWLLNQNSNPEINRRKKDFDILNDLEEWITMETSNNPKKEIWFEIQLLESFPGFKTWRDARERKRDKAANE